MDWEEEERQKRETEKRRQEAERKAILNFWSKLLSANNQLLPDIQGRFSSDRRKNSWADNSWVDIEQQWLQGKNSAYLALSTWKDGRITTEAKVISFEIRYDDKLGLYNCKAYDDDGYALKLRDTDIPVILKDLCTGSQIFLDSFNKAKEKDKRRAENTKQLAQIGGMLLKLAGYIIVLLVLGLLARMAKSLSMSTNGPIILTTENAIVLNLIIAYIGGHWIALFRDSPVGSLDVAKYGVPLFIVLWIVEWTLGVVR